MQITTVLCAAVLGIGLSSAAAPNLAFAGKKGARADASPSGCVRLIQKKGEDGVSLLLELRNGCDARFACRISWSVHCLHPDAEEEQTARAVMVEARGSESFTASAAACGDDGYRISPAVWRCDPPSTNTAAR